MKGIRNLCTIFSTSFVSLKLHQKERLEMMANQKAINDVKIV